MATEASVLARVEPAAFWGTSKTLTRIPRPSRREEPVIEHVRAWADRHGLAPRQDAARNLVVAVPATRAASRRRSSCSRDTSTWRCERQPDSPNDPTEGRIEPSVTASG